MSDLLKYFRMEAQELADGLAWGLLDLKEHGGQGDSLDQCFRLAHTLKGAAGAARQLKIAELAHTVEDVLTPFRKGRQPIPAAHMGELLRLLGLIREEVARLDEVVERGDAGGGARPARRSAHDEVARVDLAHVGELADAIGEAIVQLESLRSTAEALDRAERLASALEGVGSPDEAARGLGELGARRATALFRELRAALSVARVELAGGIDRLSGELREAQARTRELQLQPCAGVLAAVELAVREAAESLGKRVEIETSGGDIRLDGAVISALRDAALHMARNAVDHGIEPEAARLAAGKPAVGKIRLRVEQRGSRVALLCSDDGRGVDVAAVRKAVVRAGLCRDDEARALTAADALELIFGPGVSTCEAITSLSGRGVGLDVVRETAVKLSGTAAARSEPGRGTTIELVVPISLSSVVALRIEDGGHTALLPLDAVRSALRLGEDAIVRGTEHGAERDAIVVEGRLVPFARLAAVLGAPAPAGEPRCAVIVGAGAPQAVVGAERLLGAVPVIVKPLPAAAGAPPAVAGASLDVRGDPVLVLDPRGVVELVRAAAPGAAGRRERRAPPPILVVDDSLTTRMLEQSILESGGYEVDLASSGEEGLKKAAERRYGLFLVDVEMPGMSGFQFAAQVRADPALRDTPLVIVTSLSSAADRHRAREAGADDYIVKGEFDQRRLLDTVAGLLSRAQGAPS
ncbi:hybrid sensor histidine kinase/response regulator [Sorangium sp. So ce1024]|uniref:hybrid sensor histidine kinase/response regulator n=1 Tax=Sorangium sp. So ce1024 TaxID=3133327 RepID=UPI003F0A9C6D